jgi:hypothetical protein
MMKMLSSNCESRWKARSISGRMRISIWLSSKKWKSSRSIMFYEYLEVSFFIIRGWGGSYSCRMCRPSSAPSKSAFSFFILSASFSYFISELLLESIDRFWLLWEWARVRMRSIRMAEHSSEPFLNFLSLELLSTSSLISSRWASEEGMLLLGSLSSFSLLHLGF